MAATRLIPMHMQKGKTIKQCLKDRTDYAENGEKTEEGKYISSYECTPESVDLDFAATKKEYELITGRRLKSNDVIAYQLRQSFKPGEVTAEEANRIGYETAMRWTKGKHAFIVATHTDKAHIHNHIIYNSTTLDARHKFKNFLFSSIAVRRLSDIICLENGLSVIERRKPSEWQKRTVYPKRKSIRDEIRDVIDSCMKKEPKDMDELLRLLEEEGYAVKRGKNISLKGEGCKRYIRLGSLGDGYREKDLERVFTGEPETEKHEDDENVQPLSSEDLVVNKQDIVLDMQEVIAKGKGAGYENWAQVFNIKKFAKSLVYLDEHNIRDIDMLNEMAAAASKRFNDLGTRIKDKEKRMAEISELKNHIFNYSKTRDVYAEYKKHGYSKKFFEENREAITLHKAAKDHFSKLGGPVPKVKDLNEEYARILAEKKELYPQYREARNEMKELHTAKYNIDHELHLNDMETDVKNKKRGDQVL